MSYIVTARKWRPQKFDELIGQQHVVKTLKNAIEEDRLAHAYLFSGPRGVGKTSAARILAKSLNCTTNGPTVNPCGVCDNCIEIAMGNSIDVYEIDGASSRGIDNIRDLRENVKYAPSKSKYKVYIIDEVHMLTDQAFNALLKTLEEPPSHVVFIFATTEPHKVKVTIKSRCQHYTFKRISNQDIVSQIIKICQSYDIKLPEDVALLIAKASDGSMRDSQTLLDEVIAYSGKEITLEKVKRTLGIAGEDKYFLFIEFLIDKKISELIQLVNDLQVNGEDLLTFSHRLISYFRDIVLIKSLNKKAELLIEQTDENKNRLKKFSNKFSHYQLNEITNLLIKLNEELKYSSNALYLLESYCFKLINWENFISLAEILKRLEALESKITGKEPSLSVEKKVFSENDINGEYEKKQSVQNNIDIQSSVENKKVEQDLLPTNYFSKIILKINKQKKILANILKDSEDKFNYDTNTLFLSVKTEFHKAQILDNDSQLIIKKLFKDLYKKKIRIKCEIIKQENTETDMKDKVLSIFDGEVIN